MLCLEWPVSLLAPRGPSGRSVLRGQFGGGEPPEARIRPQLLGPSGLRCASVFLFCSAERRWKDPAGPRVPPAPPAPRIPSRCRVSARPAPPDRRLGFTAAPGFHLAFMGLPHSNWFQVCNFEARGLSWAALLAPRRRRSNYLRKSTSRLRGRQGSDIRPPCPRHWRGLPRAGPAELSGGRTDSDRSGRLGERSSRPLRTGHEPQGAIGSGRGGQRSADTHSQTPSPYEQPFWKGETTHAAANVGTGRPGGLGALRVEGFCLVSALHPGTTILSHCPPWRAPNLTYSDPDPVIGSYPQHPAPPKCL